MFGAKKRAHHRAQEEMRRQNEINNFNRSLQESRDALAEQARIALEREARFEDQNKILLKQLDDMTIQNAQRIADQKNFFDQQLAAAQTSADNQISALNNLMIQQQAGFDQQYGILYEQKMAADAAFAEQQRIARNVSNAYVPQSQASASAPVLSNDAASQLNATRKTKNNALSSLSIVSNPGAGGANQAGLQIA